MNAPITVARLICDERTARRVADYLGESLDPNETVCAAFEGGDGQWQVAIHFRKPPDAPSLRALVALAAGDDAAQALAFEQVATKDWVKESLEGLTPVRAGRFVVHGAHDRARVKPNDIGIEIEAALAFGTGHHGTTRGCLLALDDLARRIQKPRPLIPPPARGRVASAASRVGVIAGGGRPHPAALRAATLPFQGRHKQKKVVDVGTGSGVLAIAAAKRLRPRVTASDIDPLAVQAARGNARLNRAPAITFVHAAGVMRRAVTAPGPYDLILANILLGPLTRMAAQLSRLAAPGARVVLSGLLPAHANAVLAIYRAQGLTLERRFPLEGWMTLVLRRP